jgi:hypothetical protein
MFAKQQKKKKTTAMRTSGLVRLLLLSSLLLGSAGTIAEPTTAISDDGREVILNDSGEWQYVTQDRFATTADGQRIRLKANQRWQKISDGDAPQYQPVPISVVQRDNVMVAGGDIELILDQVHVENQRETVGKNKRLRSNLVFYLEVKGEMPGLELNPEQFSIQDSRSNSYPVFSVQAGLSPIGAKPSWVIRAKGAPRWWGVKFFSLQVAKGAVGNSEPIELRKPMRDVLKKEVESLPADQL